MTVLKRSTSQYRKVVEFYSTLDEKVQQIPNIYAITAVSTYYIATQETDEEAAYELYLSAAYMFYNLKSIDYDIGIFDRLLEQFGFYEEE